MGLCQTLPVTSYFKMIDIWMLFTMIVPFLEVVLHTTNEMFKKSKATQLFPKKRVNVVTVQPAENQEAMEEVQTSYSISSIAPFMLPLTALIFALIFWTVGLIASYSDGDNRNHQMTECLAIKPN